VARGRYGRRMTFDVERVQGGWELLRQNRGETPERYPPVLARSAAI
jgi:hypothetical protein